MPKIVRELGRLAGTVAGALLPLALAGCSPLGPAIDAEVSQSYYHSRIGNRVIHCPTGNWLKLGHQVMDADARTFRPLATQIGVDAQQVYYRQHPQPHVDRTTFEVEGKVWRDARHVYMVRDGRLTAVQGADPETFAYIFPEDVNPREWARDANHWYLNHAPVDVDLETFRFLNYGFTADRARIYTRRVPFRPVSDVSGPIEVLNRYHLRMGNRILSGSPGSTEVLDFDAIHELREISDLVLVINDEVYARGAPFPVEGVDGATFEGWGDNLSFARDAHAVYFIFHRMVRVEGADRDTFEPYEGYGSYARDAARIYYQDQVLEDADRETFRIVREGDRLHAEDRHGRFRMGRRVR